jgi:hypothetical protein
MVTAESPRFAPSQEWLEAFERQCSKTLTQLAERYAARHLGGVGPPPGSGDPTARELVVNALGDTATGVLPWDPGRITLLEHIKGVVRRRAKRHRRWLKKFPHDSMDDDNARTRDDAERALRGQQPDPHAVEAAAEALAELREFTADDPKLAAYIEGRGKGLSRTALMYIIGLSPEAYRSLRRRLRRLAAQRLTRIRPRSRKPTED